MPRRKKGALESFDPKLSRKIIVILLIILAVIITLSFFDKAGVVGTILDDYILSFLFGRIRYATPIIVLILAWFFIRDIAYNYRPTHGVGAILFLLAMSSIIHLGFEPNDMWMEALAGHGGGVFGMLAWVLETYIGSVGSLVVLIGLVLVSILLIFNTSITEFIVVHKKIIDGFGWVGRAILSTVKALFIPQSSSSLTIHSDYKGPEDEDEEDMMPARQFAVKGLHDDDEEEDDEPEEDEETINEENSEKETSGSVLVKEEAAPPWTQPVIIKEIPPLTLLSSKRGKPTSGDIEANAATIQDTLQQFGVEVSMGEVRVGPTVTQYSLKPAKGMKLSRIVGLSNDLSLALAAHPIRIEAPIPGQALVGIEVPNEKTALVSFKELLESKEFATRPHNMMIALGRDVAGKVWFADLPRMPHLLIAGATGSGKTVCVNTIIMSLLYQNTAETLRMIMVDPKRVELTLYNGIPHLLTPVITNTQKTVNALKWAIGEMDRRFEILSQAGSRDIGSYNTKRPDQKLPHIIFIIDELADLMATAASEVEAGIIRLAQMARAVGIHLVLATQRPSVDVITGLMKANIPARIAFSVASLMDSRTILDSSGAEKLLGRGDLLFQTAELSKPVRIQGAFISEEEVKNVTEHLKGDQEPVYDESIVDKPTAVSGTLNMFGGPTDDQDPLFEEAKAAVLQAGKASASLLQRRLKLGYARAARILDELEEAGVIGPGDGAKPREILVTSSEKYDTMDAGENLNVFEEEK